MRKEPTQESQERGQGSGGSHLTEKESCLADSCFTCDLRVRVSQ